MEILTHRSLDPRWSGSPSALEPGWARVEMRTVPEMAADESGLVHGGFLFSLADHAAMLAVNEPTVVLAAATARFLAPVAVGDVLVAEAEVLGRDRRRCEVRCVVRRQGHEVMRADLECVVPSRHVLDRE